MIRAHWRCLAATGPVDFCAGLGLDRAPGLALPVAGHGVVEILRF